MTTSALERLCLAHRYLYYVKCFPIIGDSQYDMMEKELLARDDLDENSPMRKVGSDLEDSYSDDIKDYAALLSHQISHE